MLSKLLKYEFKAVSRLLLPLHLLLILVTLIGRFYVQFAMSSYGPDMDSPLMLVNISLAGFYALLLFALFIVTMVYLYILRPLQHLFSNQGYLTHTLPVTPDMQIISKLIVALCWVLLDLILIGLSLFCMIVNSEFFRVLPQVVESLGEGISMMCGLPPAPSLIAFIAAYVVSFASGLLIAYMCLAVGHSFAQSKLLMSGVIWLAVSFGGSIVNTIIMVLGIFLLGLPFQDSSVPFLFRYSYTDSLSALNVFGFWYGLVFSVILGTAAYFVTRYFISKRLNLQ